MLVSLIRVPGDAGVYIEAEFCRTYDPAREGNGNREPIQLGGRGYNGCEDCTDPGCTDEVCTLRYEAGPGQDPIAVCDVCATNKYDRKMGSGIHPISNHVAIVLPPSLAVNVVAPS